MLLGLCVDASVHKELEEAKRNKPIFIMKANETKKTGYQQTWEEVLNESEEYCAEPPKDKGQ